MADESTEEKLDKSSISMLAKHCYNFMTKNIEEYIPTFSHLKAKNIKINQGQNFKPFERCEFRGLCRPKIQMFKALSEEPINNTKLLKKSDTSSIQVPKRNLKTHKVSNIVFQPNKSTDSVKVYVDLYKNKRPGIRTKSIVEDAVQTYNATRDEQEAKRNVLRSRTIFKRESISDSDLITRQRNEQENSSVCEKQRRTVKVKTGHLPSKEFLERMKDFNNSKKMKEETKYINLAPEPLNKLIPLSNNNESNRRSEYIDILPAVSLPKLKIRPVNRKEKAQCPMSIINITFQKDNESNKEQLTNTFQQQNYYHEEYTHKMKKTTYNKILSHYETECNNEQNYNYSTSKSSHFTKNIWEYPTKIGNGVCSQPYKKGHQEYDKESFYKNTYNHGADKRDLIKSFKQVQETCKVMGSFINSSNKQEDLNTINETLQTVENIMHSNRAILNSLKISSDLNEQHMDSRSKYIKEKVPVLRDSILPNKLKIPISSSENSVNYKNIYHSKNEVENDDFRNVYERRNCTSSEDYFAQGIDSSGFSEVQQIRPLSHSSNEYFKRGTNYVNNSSKFSLLMLPKKLRAPHYQSFWKST